MLNRAPVLRHSRQLGVVASLILSSLLCIGLLVLRVVHSRHSTYAWLWWNLFLAWLPLGLAFVAYNVSRYHSRLSWFLVFVCALIWLAFFPNAPYLVTDIIHLQHRTDAPFWFDLILFVSIAWTGCFLGLVSLFLMQEIVRRAAGSVISWVFAVAALGLSGFGIYLGRFLRWNSWDVFFAPTQILGSLLAGLRHPAAHSETFVFSIIFAAFLMSMYLMLVSLMHLRQESHAS
jgi:uncharacterized membrane protein